MTFINKKMEMNGETTAPKLSLDFSITIIKGLRRKLSWLSLGTKYCQLVRKANRENRSEASRRCLDNGTFDNVIFTDKSTIALENHARLSFHHWWEPQKLKGRLKHPLKVHIWAGLPWHSPIKLVIFDGIMAAEFFINSILKDTLLPVIHKTLQHGQWFQQDNDPKYTGNLTKSWLLQFVLN